MEISLNSSVTRIGRHIQNDITIQSKYVSRQHLEIHNQNSRYVLVNLSSNGTYINKVLVTGTQELKNGDEIYLSQDAIIYFENGRLSNRPFKKTEDHATWTRGINIHYLNKPIVSIGRHCDNDIRVHKDLSHVSRKHAEIHRTESSTTLFNLASTGTTVNGKLIQKQILNEGDIISLAGQVDFIFMQGTLKGPGESNL